MIDRHDGVTEGWRDLLPNFVRVRESRTRILLPRTADLTLTYSGRCERVSPNLSFQTTLSKHHFRGRDGFPSSDTRTDPQTDGILFLYAYPINSKTWDVVLGETTAVECMETMVKYPLYEREAPTKVGAMHTPSLVRILCTDFVTGFTQAASCVSKVVKPG